MIDGLVFDLNKPTVREWQPMQDPATIHKQMTFCRSLALIVKECPSEWGDPANPATFAQFTIFSPVFKDLRNAYLDAAKNTPIEIEAQFDYAQLTVQEFDLLLEQLNVINISDAITLLRKVVVKCDGLSDPKDAQAYLDVSFFKVFRPLVTLAVQGAMKEAQVFFLRSATG